MDLGDAGPKIVDGGEHPVGTSGAPVVIEVVGEDHTFVRGESPEREAGLLGRDRRREADGQRELDGQFEVDVEELRPQRDGRQVRGEVGDVDAPSEGALDLGLQLTQDFGRIGMLPEVLERPGEATLARLERRGMGDRAPAVALVLGVEGEVDADVVGELCGAGGVAGPRGRHHDRRAGGDPVVQRLEDPDVGGVARPEVVAGDDHQTIVGSMPETFGEGDLVGHRGDATGRSGRAGRPEAEPGGLRVVRPPWRSRERTSSWVRSSAVWRSRAG